MDDLQADLPFVGEMPGWQDALGTTGQPRCVGVFRADIEEDPEMLLQIQMAARQHLGVEVIDCYPPQKLVGPDGQQAIVMGFEVSSRKETLH